MINVIKFAYQPGEHEAEKASNSYLMSLIAIIAGLPLPIINLIATIIFYLGNRKGTFFVRWHCTQALLSQLSIFFINSFGFWWTVSIIFSDEIITSKYIAYLITALIFNLVEFIFRVLNNTCSFSFSRINFKYIIAGLNVILTLFLH